MNILFWLCDGGFQPHCTLMSTGLRKPDLVPGESLSLSTNINSVLEKNQSYNNLILFYIKGTNVQSYGLW